MVTMFTYAGRSHNNRDFQAESAGRFAGKRRGYSKEVQPFETERDPHFTKLRIHT